MIRRSVVRGAARAFAFAILAAVRVPAADCNGNGLDDGEEIATGAVSDCNGNGVPDPCDLMPSPFALAEVRRHEVLDTVRSLTTGDLDADGLPDVIAAVRDVLGLAVFKGDAGEGLTAFPPSGLFFDPAWVVVADANRDGKADLITEAAGGLSVHLGLGGGSLASPVRSRGDLGDPVAADITGDGRMDLVATSGGAVGIAAGSGDGLFAPPVLLPAADAPSSIAVADLDLDGRLDIAAASYDASTIALHFARGGGDFRSPISFFTSAGLDPRDAPFAIAATDHDHDGDMDVLTANYATSSLSVFAGRGGEAFAPVRVVELPGPPLALRPADLDRDGTVDLVFAGSPSAMLVAGRDDGTWDDPRALATDRCELLAIADFNGDGSPDLATDGRFEGVPVVAFLANRTVGATSSDCNRNALPDDCEIASGAEQDVNRNRVIDACEADCDRDGIPDSSAIATGASRDCDGNDVPDSCDIARGLQVDANANGVPDVCDPDCNGNRIPDFRDIALGRARDCNANGIPDGCEIEGSELLFPAASRIPTGRYPLSLVAADFNGDGIADLANTNGDDDTIGVFLGPGDGTFPEARSFPSTGRPLSLVTADWNGDGSLDLAATDTDSLELSVLFGEGDGGFHPEARVPVAVTPWWALALDLNVDGQPDIGVLDINTGFVSIVHGLGTGSFATPSLHDVGLGRPRSFTAADVTEDGILDLITSDEAPRGVSVFRGTSDSRYVERGHLPIMSLVGALVPADLNEDGHQDLAACTSGGVAILLGRGGNFIVQATYNPRAIPGSLLVRDLDGDGALDIATANTDTGDVSVLLGHGEGAFLPVGTFAAGPEARDIEAADFDRDGLLDLATCSARDHAIAIVRGQARGSFQGARHEGLGMASRGLVVTDLNQDGALDIVAGDHEATEALIILGRSDGSLEAARVFPTGDLPPEAIAAGDVNGDGFPDLAAATRLPSEVNVALGDGDGWFLPAVGYSPGEGTDPESILVVDLNGDGASEVITGDTGTEEIAVFLGSPDGQLGTARRFPGINERGKIRAAGDFNADGEMDLVVTDERAVGVARGNGDGTLLGPRLQATGRTAGLALGDFNRDGILDLVVVGLGSFSADRLHGRGDGTFEPAPGIGLGAPAWGVAAADLDRDGSLDLAFPLAEAEEVRVLRALPDGSFGHSTSVRVGAQPHGDLAAADMDRDGAPDLVFIRSLHDVAIVYNRTAAPAIDCNQNGVPDSCDLESGSSFDRDGDGLPDECRTEAGRQVPGDCNQDGALAISDPLCLIGFLFLGSERLPCGTGAASDRGNLALIDVQPDGRINIADVVHVLHFLFLGGPPPALVASADGAGCAPVEGCIEGPGCR